MSLNVTVDVWMTHDFRGRPHPEIFQKNSPRLKAVIEGVDTCLHADAEPGDPSTFGTPQRFGIDVPTGDDDEAMDVTPWMKQQR